ncbi:MAG: NifB/NifX family molybdenum-iron cluster-binding protein [Candidatus Omnitrophota bacterium]
MKICITAEGKTLDSTVDARFGRCKYFLVVDTETLQCEAIENHGMNASGGAGIQAGQLIAKAGVQAVLTGHVGPNAFQTLQAAGIEVFTGASQTVRETIEQYKKGKFKAVSGPSVSSHSGMPGKNK